MSQARRTKKTSKARKKKKKAGGKKKVTRKASGGKKKAGKKKNASKKKTPGKKKTGGKKKTAKKKTGTKTTASSSRSPQATSAEHSAARAKARRRPKLRLTRLVPPGFRGVKGVALTLLLGVVLLACVKEQPAPTPPPVAAEPEPEIRVRLQERAFARTNEFTVTLSPGPWELRGESGKREGIVAQREATLECSLEGGVLRIKRQEAHGSWLELEPIDEGLTFTILDRTYLGSLKLEAAKGGGVQATNTLGLESYLLGVVGYESPLGWLDEALYSQAVAARTYALVGLKPKRDYDVVDDTRDQVYRGLMPKPEHRARLKKLVDGTRGEIVTYEGKPITTYFHSTCGGDTVPAYWVFPWVHEPFEPWSGANDCPCQPSKYYRWEQPRKLDEGTKPGTQSAVQKLVLELPLKEARVEHWPRGGYAKELVLVDSTGETTRVPAWETRQVFGLRGYAFDVKLASDGMSLEFTGRGWGHGVGMCQFGTQGRAKQGWDHAKILANAYPGTQLTTLPYGK